MSASGNYIFLGNTTSIKITGLQSALDDSYVNDATITLTLKDPLGDAVTGETWPISLSYTAASNGDYTGTFSHAVNVSANQLYTAEITATLPDGSVAYFDVPVLAKVRTS